MKVTKLGWAAYVLAFAIIVVDQASKYWILNVLDLPMRAHVAVAGPFSLTMVWNRGVSFGLLWADKDVARWGLAVFSIIVSILLAGWVRKADRPLMAVSLALIMGGAVGNVIDRIRFGAVADFLDLSALWFPWIFNIADAAISTGIALLLLDMLRTERRTTAAKPSQDAA